MNEISDCSGQVQKQWVKRTIDYIWDLRATTTISISQRFWRDDDTVFNEQLPIIQSKRILGGRFCRAVVLLQA